MFDYSCLEDLWEAKNLLEKANQEAKQGVAIIKSALAPESEAYKELMQGLKLVESAKAAAYGGHVEQAIEQAKQGAKLLVAAAEDGKKAAKSGTEQYAAIKQALELFKEAATNAYKGAADLAKVDGVSV